MPGNLKFFPPVLAKFIILWYTEVYEERLYAAEVLLSLLYTIYAPLYSIPPKMI